MKLTRDSYFLFSGGEVHCSVPLKSMPSFNIVCLDYTMNGFMALCELYSVIRKQGLQYPLIYPYLPYARQDRDMVVSEPFSLKIFCEFLNAQGFPSVTVYDPHSDVGPALIKNCKVIPQEVIARSIIPARALVDPNVIFVSPDAGAYKKVAKLIEDSSRIAVGTKRRDAKGNITDTEILYHGPIAGRECVIVDDICDGGATFTALAKILKEEGAISVWLYVTHGIFSKGFLELSKHIDHIFTTNSFPQDSDDIKKLRESGYMTVGELPF